MKAYYNEHDPSAAAWLRELIKQGHIADGVVDTRSIEDVVPDELLGFTQCHFFAGIGGWSLALRMAGWSDERPVWTGSAPCQPFSAAGQGKGLEDERHLWPAFYRLIDAHRPGVVFGEQVASVDVVGRAHKGNRRAAEAKPAWFDVVRDDLERARYAVGACDLPGAGIGAPHRRQRLFWVACGVGLANATSSGSQGGVRSGERVDAQLAATERGGATGRLGHAECIGAGRDTGAGAGAQGGPVLRAVGDDAGPSGAVGGLADAEHAQRRALGQHREDGHHRENGGRPQAHGMSGARCEVRYPGPVNGFWRDADWLACRDGKWRPVEPGTFPLVDGLPRGVVPSSRIGMEIDASKTSEARVMRLRGYGNAIVPQVGAAFVQAFMGARNE